MDDVRGEDGFWEVPRDWREESFADFMDAAGLDYHGHICGEGNPLSAFILDYADDDPMSHYVIDTPLFTMRPYYWGDERAVYRLPNFVYKPWHFEMSWYKYPLRDARSNCRLSDAEWRYMVDSCGRFAASLPDFDEDSMPFERDKRTEADIVARIWSDRLAGMTESADRYWGAATMLLRALQEGDGLEKAVAEAMSDTGWDESFDGTIDVSRWRCVR